MLISINIIVNVLLVFDLIKVMRFILGQYRIIIVVRCAVRFSVQEKLSSFRIRVSLDKLLFGGQNGEGCGTAEGVHWRQVLPGLSAPFGQQKSTRFRVLSLLSFNQLSL